MRDNFGQHLPLHPAHPLLRPGDIVVVRGRRIRLVYQHRDQGETYGDEWVGEDLSTASGQLLGLRPVEPPDGMEFEFTWGV